MQQYQSGMANSTDPKLRVVSASDLSTQTDGVHLTADSQVTLGHRYADALYAL